MKWLNHIIIFKCLQLLLDKYKWMFACILAAKGIIWYLHPSSLTLLRKHQSVSVEFKWHKWAFLILNEILLSVPLGWSSPIPANSSSLQIKPSRYNVTNKHRNSLKIKQEGELPQDWGIGGTIQQWVPWISLLFLVFPG